MSFIIIISSSSSMIMIMIIIVVVVDLLECTDYYHWQTLPEFYSFSLYSPKKPS